MKRFHWVTAPGISRCAQLPATRDSSLRTRSLTNSVALDIRTPILSQLMKSYGCDSAVCAHSLRFRHRNGRVGQLRIGKRTNSRATEGDYHCYQNVCYLIFQEYW